MSNQLVKKDYSEGYRKVFPKTFIDAIKDRETGMTLAEILQGFNMYFLSYNGNKAETRNQVPPLLRKEGLWITYVLYDHTVVSEWYDNSKTDDDSWGSDENWRIASNALVGDISVSADGYWVINGIKTASKAQGERGTTPLLRIYDNKLQVSYTDGKTYNYIDDNPVFTQYRTYNNKIQVSRDLGKTWEDASEELAYKFKVEGNKLKMSKDLGHSWETISDYIAAQFRWAQEGTSNNIGKIQISRDEGKTWSNLTNSFSNNLHISRYIGANESLPTTGIAEGTIYMKGPYYDENDANNDYPIYRMWVYAWKGNTLAWQDNGEFQSVVAGVVQEKGNSELNVMSQAAVTRELTELESVRVNRATTLYGVEELSMAFDTSNGTIAVELRVRQYAYIYHERGYVRMSTDVIKVLDYSAFDAGLCFVYAYNNDINIANGLANVPYNAAILEVFYTVETNIAAFAWTSPFVEKSGTTLYKRSYCFAKNLEKEVAENASAIAENTSAIQEIKANVSIKPLSAKIFQRVGCIGDSYTAAWIKKGEQFSNKTIGCSWPHYMEGLTNNRYDNWGVSGATAKSYYLGNSLSDIASVKAEGNKCQAYIIGLMINDRDSNNPYYTPVGSIQDIGTDNDTYYAYYYKLIQEVISVNSDAKIFCNTCPKWSYSDTYNQAVRDVVTYCKEQGQYVYLVDLADSKYKDYYQNEVFVSDYIHGHYTAIGYEYMAECYLRILSDVINNNVAEFQNVAFIPFDE